MKIIGTILLVAVLFKLLFVLLEAKSLYIPTSDLKGNPVDLGLQYENVTFKTVDGINLNSWFIPGNDAKFTFLYCHGNWGNISDRLDKIKFFHNLGVNFFIFDYRGFGKSKGTPGEKGLYKDAQAAFDYLLTRKELDKSKIIVYGKSLGGPVAAELCINRNAKALILEGSFASVIKRVQQKIPFLPAQLLVSQKFDTLAKVKKINIPKLIVHGQQDEIIKFEHGKLIFEKASVPKEFLPFQGGHNDDVFVTSEKYMADLRLFLEEIEK